ncbi:MAG TPA: CHAT domain-containing protein [Chloroflexia bacterium]|nr:CHAT domain-containing protein [Chloroflexia bacterium]
MSNALDKLVHWFDHHDWPHQWDGERGLLKVVLNHPDGKLELGVRPIYAGMMLLDIVGLETVRAEDERALLDLAWRLPLIGLARNPDDGELYARLTLQSSAGEEEEVIISEALKLQLSQAIMARAALPLIRAGMTTEQALDRVMDDFDASKVTETDPLLSLPAEAGDLLGAMRGERNQLAFVRDNLERFSDSVLSACSELMRRTRGPRASDLWRFLEMVWAFRRVRELASLPANIQQLLQDLKDVKIGDEMVRVIRTVEACQELLKYLGRTNTSALLCATLIIQGNAHQVIYDYANNPDEADRAEAAYQEALEVHTAPEADPSDWSKIQSNLGLLFSTRYARTGEDRYAQEAERAFRWALEVCTQQADPYGWARTQNNLGSLFSRRYDRTGEERYAQEAERAYQETLQVHTREAAPSAWAGTQSNLGTLLTTRYEQTEEDRYAEEAERAFRMAIEVLTWEATPYAWAQIQSSLGNLFSRRYTQSHEERYAKKAYRAYRAALGVRTQEVAPSDWAGTQGNLGNLLTTKYERTGEEFYAQEAEEAYRAALSVMNPLVEPAFSLPPQRNLARQLAQRGQWVQADAAYADAVHTAELQYLAAPSDAERRRLMTEHVTLYQEHAYCLLRMGAPARALARLDEGRARGLGETLGLEGEARSAHGEERVARLRALRGVLRYVEGKLDVAEGLLRASTPGPALNNAADERDRAAAQVRSAYDELRAEVRALGLDPPVLTVDDLAELPLPSYVAVVALLPSSVSHALLLHEGIVLAVELPDFRKVDIQALVYALSPQVEVWADDYSAYTAQKALAYALHENRESARTSAGPGATVEAELHEAVGNWFRTLDEVAATQGNYEAGWYYGYQLAFEAVRGEGHLSAERAALKAWKGLVERTVKVIREGFWSPIRAVLSDEVREVLLLVGGEAALLPLHAATDMTVGYAPSLGVWLRCREAAIEREANSLLIATPSPPDDLAFTSAEAEWLVQLFAKIGGPESIMEPLHLDQKEATVERVLRDSAGRGVVHFSGHAGYNWNQPLLSGLLCHDGVLTLARARQEMDLQTTRLVGLSACSTGVSDVFQSGDEWVGLPAGLLEAGASAVVASLWPVNDLSTAFLMDRFYSLWLEPEARRTISGALREAAQWLRRASWADLGERVAASELSDELRSLLDSLLAEMQTASSLKMPHSAGSDFIIEMARANPDEKPFASPYYWGTFAAYGAVF